MINDFIKILCCFFTSFFITTIIAKFYLNMAKKKQIRQYVREDIVQTHFKKNGTPTMGGICFIIATLLSYIIFDSKFYKDNMILAIIFIFVFYGLIGLIDDLFKISKKNSSGIKGIVRLFLELLGFLIVIKIIGIDFFEFIIVPITNKKIVLGSMGIIYFIIVLLGTCNAVNFSDGLDGLSSGLVIISLTPFLLISLLKHNYSLTMFIVSLIGSLFGFLKYNFIPAKLFMGDVGSLSLGGVFAIIAIVLKSELLILISGLLFFIEIISVILQVGFFKLSHGKRLFKMAPIHHHFEKKGYPEWKVVMMFWIIAVGFNIIAIIVGVI